MPVITLLSDLGTRDASVATIRALLWRHVPDAAIIDMSHRAEQYDLQQAAYLLLSAYASFPKGTIHVLLADVFASDAPRMLAVEKDGYVFIAPDNGILALAFGEQLENPRLCFEFNHPCSFNEWIDTVGKVIQTLLHGDNIGTGFAPCSIKKGHRLLQPKVMHDGVDCNVLYIDRYDNIVLDITAEQFQELIGDRPFRIKVMRKPDITLVSTNYNDVQRDSPLCRFNTAGFLEIAINHGQAAATMGLESFTTVNLRYQTIKIFY